MAKDLGELLVKLGADIGELKSGLNAARSELSSFKEQATSFGETVKKALAFAGVAVGIWEIAGALKEFATSAAMTGARTESLGIAMNKVGENAGLSAASLNYYVNQLKKAGITTQESMSAIVTAMVSGIDLTQLQALATRARDVAVLAGKNTSETLQTIMHALVSRQMEVIRNLNVPMANYEDAVKKISRSLNIDKDQIDSVTLANALLKEFMESSKGAAGAAEAADKSVDKQMKSLARYAEEAKNSLWAFFEPIMQAGVQALASYWKEMEKWAKDNEAALRNLGTTIGEVLRKKLGNGGGCPEVGGGQRRTFGGPAEALCYRQDCRVYHRHRLGLRRGGGLSGSLDRLLDRPPGPYFRSVEADYHRGGLWVCMRRIKAFWPSRAPPGSMPPRAGPLIPAPASRKVWGWSPP